MEKSYGEIEEDEIFKDHMIKDRSTVSKSRIRIAIGSFLEYLKTKHDLDLTPSGLVDYCEPDDGKERKKRIRRMENYWQGYITWLSNEYQNQYTRSTQKPISVNTIKGYAQEVKSFLKDQYIDLPRAVFPRKLKGTVTKQANEKMPIRKTEMRLLVGSLSANVYKAMVLVQYQSGIDSDTLAYLKYGDIKKGLEGGQCPIMLNLRRHKTNTVFKTFIGYDAIQAINTYLEERRLPRSVCRNHEGKKYSWIAKMNICPKCKGVISREIPEIKDSDYLFVSFRRGKPESMKTHYRKKIREAAITCGLLTNERLEESDFSPVRSHGLRAAFSSIMRNEGMPEKMVTYMMGHCDTHRYSYLNLTDEELREMYSKHMKAVSISEESDKSLLQTEINELKTITNTQQEILMSQQEDSEKMAELLDMNWKTAEFEISRYRRRMEKNEEIIDRLLPTMLVLPELFDGSKFEDVLMKRARERYEDEFFSTQIDRIREEIGLKNIDTEEDQQEYFTNELQKYVKSKLDNDDRLLKTLIFSEKYRKEKEVSNNGKNKKKTNKGNDSTRRNSF